jgi:hypothetical protein
MEGFYMKMSWEPELSAKEVKDLVDKLISDASEMLGMIIEITKPLDNDLSDGIRYWCMQIKTEPKFSAYELEEKLQSLFPDNANISFDISRNKIMGLTNGEHFVLLVDDYKWGGKM